MAQTHITTPEDPPTRTEEAARSALVMLMKLTGSNVVQIQNALRLKSRQGVYDKLSGKTKINLKDIDRLMAFFEVPAAVLFMEKAELLTWLGSSGWSDQPGRVDPCIYDCPAAA